MSRRNDSEATRHRLLEAAVELFAQRGFARATVGEICRRASANIAAVNYHFGGKANLYRHAWRHAHEAMVRRFPPDGGVVASAPAAQRLRGRINAVLQRVLSADGREFRIMSHEMAEPTGLLEQVLRDAIGPLRESMESVVAELLGPAATPRNIRMCALSVVAPCMHLRHRMMHRIVSASGDASSIVPELTRHLTEFSLAGIAAVRRRRPRDGGRKRL
jgi:AcrR family transcriptional regulator